MRCVSAYYDYRLCKDGSVIFLAHYVGNIKSIDNNVEVLLDIKCWLTEQFRVEGY